MKKLLFLEQPDHYSRLRQYADGESIFIGLNPYSAYHLESLGVPFRTPDQYYQHEDFWGIYGDCTARVLNIVTTLDNILGEVDGRFRENRVQPFFLSLYVFKLLVDPVMIYLYWLNCVFQQECPDTVYIIAGGKRLSPNREGLFRDSDSVCAELLPALGQLHGFHLHNVPQPLPKPGKASWLRAMKNSSLYQEIRDRKRMFVRGAEHGSKTERLRHHVLDMDCRDLSVMRRELGEGGISLQEFPVWEFQNVRAKESCAAQKLIEAVDQDEAFQQLCSFEGISFYGVIRNHLKRFMRGIETFYQKYQWMGYFLKRSRFDAVVTKSTAPFELENVMASDICKKENIPHVTWMHGGYGGNKTFLGYDMTDFILGDYYFTYGDAVNRAITRYFPTSGYGSANFEEIQKRYSVKPLEIMTAGAAWMETVYNGCGRPRNERPVILLIMGELWYHNQYYMGGNMPYAYSQKWRDMKAILKEMIPFQESFEIIVKSYPGDDWGPIMWRQFLDGNGGVDIQVIKKEEPMSHLLKRSDLVISLWVSTTFFEAALTECDQFLYDDSDLTDEMRSVLARSFFFQDDLAKFCHMLGKYLKEGRFYQRPKTEFRDTYMDFRNRPRRAALVTDRLLAVINSCHKEPRFEKSFKG